MKISSVIWDYDGTLADTRQKNLNVTKAILTKIIGDFDIENSVLNSISNYEQANTRSANWRDLYKKEFGLNERQIDAAGKMWTKVQSMDDTDVQLFPGIDYTVQKLSEYPQGIVSQNSSGIIKSNLERYRLKKYFGHIIGYEEVELKKQKPDPDGLLTCISRLSDLTNNHSVVYIGDHITDIECAHNANEWSGRNTVISILLNNNGQNEIKDWKFRPDYVAGRPQDIPEIIIKITNT
jgi:N-acetyl-D-muramate 6-phosphate phosphatase